MKAHDCRRCGAHSAVSRPSKAYWLLIAPFWAVLLFVGACCALMLPLNLVLVPAWLACAGAVGRISDRMATARCGACGACGSESAARTPEVTRRSTGPANEGPMEGALIREA